MVQATLPFAILLQVYEFDWSTILYKLSPFLHLTNISHLTLTLMPLHLSLSQVMLSFMSLGVGNSRLCLVSCLWVLEIQDYA
ncbi:hypothetical protein QL285_007946 [Trifolium repens]|nr:hypothetical protein QL285_007946 [Trifolium repens]